MAKKERKLPQQAPDPSWPLTSLWAAAEALTAGTPHRGKIARLRLSIPAGGSELREVEPRTLAQIIAVLAEAVRDALATASGGGAVAERSEYTSFSSKSISSKSSLTVSQPSV